VNDQQRFKQIDEIFSAAVRLEGIERVTFLDDRCAGDADLRKEVDALLAEDDASLGLLDKPILGRLDLDGLRSPLEEPSHPERIGQYRVVRRIGRGGMGVVYEAEQDSPRRIVALKVLHVSHDSGLSESAAQRLSHEAHILGRLQHPGIAQVYEAGVFDLDTGEQPYFAMEYIVGERLDHFAEREQLGTRERVELIAKICDALHHAHERGVVHRDIKPANILVDAAGQPKILDFGVARLTDSDVQMTTMHTSIGQLLGTVTYMSPEQASGNSTAIDARSDVYTLGVVAYELLSSRLPYPVGGQQIHDALRIIHEREPVSLSTGSRELAGDIDTIIRKALEKDPSQRYQSAEAFAEDLRRYLHQQPIRARRPSTVYELRKFARRNRTVVVGVAACFVLLLGGVAATSWQALVATRARADVERQRDTLATVLAFLTDDLLAAADPTQLIVDGDITLIGAIENAAAMLDERFADSPEAEGIVRETIGQALLHRDRVPEALPHLERSLIIARESDASLETLVGRINLVGMARYDLDETQEAFEHFSESISLIGQQYEEYPKLAIVSYSYRGNTLFWMDDVHGAYEDLMLASDLSRRFHPDSIDHASLLASLAVTLKVLHGDEAALPLAEESVERYRSLLGPDHPDTLKVVNNYAQLLTSVGDFEQAETLFLDVMASRIRTLGTSHSDVFISQFSLAVLYKEMERYDEAIELANNAYASFLDLYGAQHRYTRRIARLLAEMYATLGDPEESERWRLLEVQEESSAGSDE
jgi:eukaryotic-like serine/threonine-protein kinase